MDPCSRLRTKLILLHSERIFANHSHHVHVCHYKAAALLNVLKHTLHTCVLQPLGSSEPKSQTAPSSTTSTSFSTHNSALQVFTAPGEPQPPREQQALVESREQNGAILPEEQCAIKLFSQVYPAALVDPFHTAPLS